MAKNRTGWYIACICMLMFGTFLWLGISAFWRTELEPLPAGAVLALDQDVTEQELQYAAEHGWEIQNIKKDHMGRIWIFLGSEEKNLNYHTTEELTGNVFNRQIGGETLNAGMHRRLLGQMDTLSLLVVLIPAEIWILCLIWRRFCRVRRRDWQAMAEGILMMVSFSLICGTLFGTLRIPRAFLPVEQIFDFSYYQSEILHFLNREKGIWAGQEIYENIRHLYLTGMQVFGVFIAGIWGATIWLYRLSRKYI